MRYEGVHEILMQDHEQRVHTSSRRKRFDRQVDSVPDDVVSKVIERIRFSDDMLVDISNEFGLPSSIVGEIYKRAIEGGYRHLIVTSGIDSAMAGTPDKDHIKKVSDGVYEGVMMRGNSRVTRVFRGSAGTARGNWLEWIGNYQHADTVVTETKVDEPDGDYLYGVYHTDNRGSKCICLHRSEKTALAEKERLDNLLKSIDVPGVVTVAKIQVFD